MTQPTPPDPWQTLRLLHDYAQELTLPCPREIRISVNPRLLTLTLAKVSDALAWCTALDAKHHHSVKGEVYSAGAVEWLGWRVQIHSFSDTSNLDALTILRAAGA